MYRIQFLVNWNAVSTSNRRKIVRFVIAKLPLASRFKKNRNMLQLQTAHCRRKSSSLQDSWVMRWKCKVSSNVIDMLDLYLNLLECK